MNTDNVTPEEIERWKALDRELTKLCTGAFGASCSTGMRVEGIREVRNIVRSTWRKLVGSTVSKMDKEQ